MKNLRNRYFDGKSLGEDDLPIASRNFRKVLQSVERGEEELGEVAPDVRYHFHSPEEVDMSLPCSMFMSRSEYGSMAESDFVERLKDRLGLYEDVTAPPPSPPATEPAE